MLNCRRIFCLKSSYTLIAAWIWMLCLGNKREILWPLAMNSMFQFYPPCGNNKIYLQCLEYNQEKTVKYTMSCISV